MVNFEESLTALHLDRAETAIRLSNIDKAIAALRVICGHEFVRAPKASRSAYQLKYQQKLKAEGKCTMCCKPRDGSPSAHLCAACLIKRREYYRKKKGCKPHEAGGKGRPPMTVQ